MSAAAAYLGAAPQFSWTIASSGVVIAFVLLWLAVWSDLSKLRREWQRRLAGALVQWPVPTVATVDPYQVLGVPRSLIAQRHRQEGKPPYVRRDKDAELESALRKSGFVVLVGPSWAGKSRTAYEAILRLFPRQPLLVPSSPDALLELFVELDPPLSLPRPAVLWLDELQTFLMSGTLDQRAARAWENGERVVAVGTMTLSDYDLWLHSPFGAVGRKVLQQAVAIRLPATGTTGEVKRAQDAYQGEDFHEGIGPHFAASDELIDRVNRARDLDPHAYAVIRAAVDWRRCGIANPIPEPLLAELSPKYLEEFGYGETTGEWFAPALRWAQEPVSSSVQLLTRVESQPARYRPLEYVVQYFDLALDGQQSSEPVPDFTWRYVLKETDMENAFGIAVEAYARGKHSFTIEALERAVGSERRQDRIRAWACLALLHRTRGDLTAAATAERRRRDEEYERDEEAGEYWFEDARRLIEDGTERERNGDAEAAEQLYKQAIEKAAGEPDAAEAAARLGLLLEASGKVAPLDLLDWVVKEVRAETRSAAAQAPLALGKLLEARSASARARAAYEKSLELMRQTRVESSGDWPGDELEAQVAAPEAAARLALLLRGSEVAENELVNWTRNSVPEDLGSAAVLELGTLLEERNARQLAKAAYRDVIEHEKTHPSDSWLGNWSRAALRLGDMNREDGAVGEAEWAYELVISGGAEDPWDNRAMAAAGLGVLRVLRGKLSASEALAWFEKLSVDVAYAGNQFARLLKPHDAEAAIAIEHALLDRAKRHAEEQLRKLIADERKATRSKQLN